MSTPGSPVVPAAESARRVGAPVIALAASSLAMLCTVSMVDVVRQLSRLDATDERFAGWFATGAVVTLAAALLALTLLRRAGSGPPLSLGAAVSGFGLALGGAGVTDAVQLALALLVLGLAVGGLLGGGLGMTLELPRRHAIPTLLAWGLPLVAAWPIQAEAALRGTHGDDLRLALSPPIVLLAPLVTLVICWGVVSMLLDPVVAVGPPAVGEAAWSVLLLVLGVAVLLVMTVGFDGGIQPVWLRPLTVALGGFVAIGWALVALTVADDRARLAFVAASVVALAVPVVLPLLVGVADADGSTVGWPQLAALTLATVAGVVVGAWRPLPTVPLALVALALTCAGAWVMPAQPWSMAAAAVPLAGAAGAVWSAGLCLATDTPSAVVFVGFASVGAVVLALLLSVPVGWALVGDVAISTDDQQAAGRTFLGLVFAVSLVAAAYTAIVGGRIRRRDARRERRSPEVELTPGPAPLLR